MKSPARETGWLAVIALLPALPLALGYGGQDFHFHLSSWMSMRDAWLAGTLRPVWAAGANFGLGDPHLGFYPPVSLLLGGLSMLLLAVKVVAAAFVWIAVLAAGSSMYYASGAFVAKGARLLAAALYMLSPYLVATVLVRFAAGELLVQAMLPLVLLAFYKAIREQGRRAPVILAALLGVSWLTNIPASIVLGYALLPVATLCAWERRAWGPAVRVMIAEAGGLALASFHLAPAWAERGWIHQQTLTAADPRRLLLFMRPPAFPESALMFLFWAIALAGVGMVWACLRGRTARLEEDAAGRTWVWLMGVALFFQVPLSYWLWTRLPELAAVQMPFRFLLLPGAVLPWLLLAKTTHTSRRKPVAIGLAMTSLLPLLLFAAMQSASRSGGATELVQDWQRNGYKSAPEYVPAGALAPDGSDGAASVSAETGVCVASQQNDRGRAIKLSVASDHGCRLRLSTFYYPYWQAVDEDGTKLATSSDPAGLLLVAVPGGIHAVRVEFRAASWVRTMSLGVSLLALAGLVAMLAWRRWSSLEPYTLTEAATQG